MGIGDITNSLLGGGEKLLDGGKKLLGEGVDYTTDKIGDGLDYVGAHKAADVVEDWGDGVASDLGATPGEQQLDETEEADELVHGSPAKIRESAKHLRDFHSAFDKVGQGLKKVDSSGWKGEGGGAFRKKFGVHPTKWTQAAEACETAAGALEAYADTVKWAQGQAEEAVALYKKGVKAGEDAADDYRTKAETYNAKVRAGEDPGPKPHQDLDAGRADIKAAVHKLAEARKQRNTAASEAQGKVKAALAHAPAEPPPLERLEGNLKDGALSTGIELTHFGGGVVKGTAGLVNFVRGLNPTDPYNITHPSAYMQNVSMTLSGLVSTAAHPERTAKTMWDEFRKDPSEFGGRMLPELFGTKGLGTEMGLARKAAETGLARRAAETAAGREARAGAEGAAGRTGRGHLDEDPVQPTRDGDSVHSGGTDPIDLASGRMYLPQTDVTLPGTLPLLLTRRVESGYDLGRWFGPSWSSTLDQRLEIDAEGVVHVTEDGLLLSYPHPAPGLLTLPHHGPRRLLDRVDDGYTITDPRTHRTWHFADRGPGLAVLEQIDDRNGNWITFEYDAGGTPLGVFTSAGQGVRITTGSGRVTAYHLATTGEELKRFGYTDGNLTEVTDSSGLPLGFTYDEAGRVTSWTDTNDRSYTYEYDDRDRCIAEGGSAGHMALRLTYGEPDPETGLRTTTATTAEGHTRRYLVNDTWQVVAETDPLGATTRYHRDRHNRLLSTTDALGHTTTFEYDDAGNLTSVTRPDGRGTRAEYNDLGLPVKVVHADGTVTRQTYDERGNRTSVTDAAGRTTFFTSTDAGHLTSVTDPLGNTTTIVCDRAGLPVVVTDPLGATTRFSRNALGLPTTITDPTGATTRLDWSIEGRLTGRTAPDGTTERWTYDGEGNCTSHTNALGGVSYFEYTHFDLLTARTGPDGVRYEFEHDSELRLTKVTNPQGLTWTYEYDAAGRLVTETDFDDRALEYEYDAAGRLLSRRNALGEVTSFERNEFGQVLRKDTAGRITTYTYDLTDQLAQASGPDGTTLTLLRDRYGRLHSETVDGRTVTYTYDPLGRRTGRTTPAGAETTWSYDAAGRRTGMVASGRPIDFTYDDAGREVTRRIGVGVALEHTFDALGRLTSQSVTGVGGHQVQHRAYTYRADGNLTGIEDHLSGSRRFDLDAAGRVTAVHAAGWTERYAYDEAGNQTEASWPTDHPGAEATGPRSYAGTRITRAGNVRYGHDALGRITLRQKTRLSRKPDTWRYEWDAEDRLTSVVTPDGTRWRYTYDPLGRRTAKLRLAEDGETVLERVTFTWDGTTLCEQTTTSADLPHPVTLTWDHQGLRPLSQTERITATEAPQQEIDSRFFAIVTDLVGTPSELIDEQGDIAWRTRSTLWGTTAWTANSTTYTPLRFPGQYYDPETGLHYNYFRHYDPETARYLTPDPLGLVPAPNPDTYVHNPHGWSDPLGLAPVDGCTENPTHMRSSSRNAAFREAKRDLDIPMAQHPDEIRTVPMTDRTGQQVMDASHNPVMTREYVYTRRDGSRVIIQDHAYGHYYGEGGVGDQGPHFNVRPWENPRTGKVPGTAQHYEY
ncbi:RHS domain-containing protein [Streptomyces actinomycinicus]|uniref:RHS domain-containing protein n=1 Tax=Streptomyces actinomycinicus TaxID=1695166 RepID=A0A937EEE3_9ACTN|nr:HNH/endonuclease VII fold putative polymorphic toxin [Streptomyces actinomycinicus]MBL1081231.1 RHS domain-containing protein [Streptomyces actinomycinicus]